MERPGDELVLATTNGAPTIVAAAACAPTVLLACLLNLDAVIMELLRREDPHGARSANRLLGDRRLGSA